MKSKTKQLAALVLTLVLGAPAHAAITSASSEGYALNASVDLLGSTLLDVNLLGTAAGSTAVPGSYPAHTGVSGSLIAGLPLLATGIHATAGVGLLYGDATFVGDQVQGKGGVSDLDLAVKTYLFGIPTSTLIGLSDVTLESVSTVSGDWGSLSAVGHSTITNATLNILGVNFDIAAMAAANSGPNADVSGLLDILGVHLVLNEQIGGACSSFDCQITTNALHLWVDPLNLGLAGVDIVIGHSMAQVAAVPEPEQWGMMLAGLGLVGFVVRRRKQA